MATAQQEIWDKIVKDITDDKGFDNVNTKRLFYYLETIKDITSGGSGDIEEDIQLNVDSAQDLLGSGGSAIVAGQGYILDNGGVTQLPTGISFIRVRGINLPSGAKGFDPNAEAYVDNIATYVPCTYDVATNTARFDYLLWAGHISQAGTAAPTVGVLNYNISGETPTFGYISEGVYSITFSGGKLVDANATKHYSFVYEGDSQGFYTVEGNTDTEATIKCYRSGALTDDRLIEAYIEIRLVYTP